MAGRVDPRSAAKLAALEELANKVRHAHGLVEQFAAAAKHGRHEPLAIPLRRAFSHLKTQFMGGGLDALSQLAGSMELAAGRGSAPQTKVRILREGVGSMRHQLELEKRSILSDRRPSARGDAPADSRE